jgi:ER membrane protein complex subunit 3
MGEADDFLVLDPQLQNWVLFPILLVMFAVSCFRHFLPKLLSSPKTPTVKSYQDRQALARSRIVRENSDKIPASSFYMRRDYLTNTVLVVPPTNPDSPLDNMAAMENFNMGDMVKNNMAMVVSQILMMTWVEYFFSGFVLGKENLDFFVDFFVQQNHATNSKLL